MSRESGFYQLIIDPLIKRAALLLLILMQIGLARAQSVTDSNRIADTASAHQTVNDTVPVKPVIHKAAKKITDTTFLFQTDTLRYSTVKPADLSNLPVSPMDLLKASPNFNFSGKPIHIRSEHYERNSYDGLFYLLVGLLFYFAIVKMFFGKYLGNLLTLFFRASMRQQQLREQVLQSPFPSLLLNILFVITGGVYGAFLLRSYNFGSPDSFWIHFSYCASILAALYLIKFMVLRIIGWIFNIKRAVETYLFVVFMTNKIIGIFLLPFLILISFSGTGILEIWITLSIIMIGIFYIYRFIAGYSTLHKEIKISGLHFFLYLCAFEVAPLLLIYKVLITYLEKA
jgi:hypothetical protein